MYFLYNLPIKRKIDKSEILYIRKGKESCPSQNSFIYTVILVNPIQKSCFHILEEHASTMPFWLYYDTFFPIKIKFEGIQNVLFTKLQAKESVLIYQKNYYSNHTISVVHAINECRQLAQDKQVVNNYPK